MSTLTRAYSEQSGTIAYASSVNKVVDDLYSTVNALNSQNTVNSSIGILEVDQGNLTFYFQVFS